MNFQKAVFLCKKQPIGEKIMSNLTLTMKNIRKELAKSNIVLPMHVQEEISKRGYFKKDIIQCMWTGEITEMQYHRKEFKTIIEGFDFDGLPMVLVVGFYRENRNKLAVITAFPPIKPKFKRVI